jgi:hypothetical protein
MTGHFDPLARKCKNDSHQGRPCNCWPLKSFTLEFDCAGSFKWSGQAQTLGAAEALARAELAARFATFNAKAARLVSMEATS